MSNGLVLYPEHFELTSAEIPIPVIVLHGLLGSSRNWQGVLKLLEQRACMVALDLRNHGKSPHNAEMSYPVMAADVLRWADKQGIERFHIVGHSMGGKVAMRIAASHSARVASLTVVDIAPRAYPPRWEREFALLRQMPVDRFRSRSEAEAWLEPEISDWAFRKFLITNLQRNAAGGFEWAVPIGILESALPQLFQQVPSVGEHYDGPVLWIRGQRSRFVEDADLPMIERFFPHARMNTVESAGHNVHFDQPETFAKLLMAHLQSASG